MKNPRILVLAAALAALAIIAVSQTTVVGLPGSSAIIGAPGTWPATFPPSVHTHAAADVISGVFAIGLIPTGTTGTTAALGNHTHAALYQPIITGAPGTWPAFGTAALQPSTAFTQLVAKADLVAQAASIGNVAWYNAVSGTYRFSCYIAITQAATTSSTMPACLPLWTDMDTSGVMSSIVTPTSAVNTVGTTSANNAVGLNSGTVTISVKAATTIWYSTVSYASAGATPMQYSVHIKLEFLGT